MAYASLAQVETAAGGGEALRKLTDTEGSGSVQQGPIDAAVAEADSMIDSYAHKRHRVPMLSPTLTVQMLSARMAVRILRRNRGMSIMQDDTGTEADNAWLEMAAKGLVSMVGEPAPEKSELVVDRTSRGASSHREVSRRKLRGMW